MMAVTTPKKFENALNKNITHTPLDTISGIVDRDIPYRPVNPLSAKSGGYDESFDPKLIFTGNLHNNAGLKDNTVIDSAWVSARFLVPDDDLDKEIAELRYTSSASLKYVDTSLGKNTFINPRPGFNPLTDPKADNPIMGYNTPNLNPSMINTGIGEGYSSLIDDNQETVFLEFGLPKFNSLLDFFFRAIDYSDSVLANTGRPATFYTAGVIIGSLVTLIAFPILAITINAIKLAANILTSSNSLKFYYFDSNMPMYWGVVNTLVTQLVTEQGLLSPILSPGSSVDTVADKKKNIDKTQIGVPMKISQADIDSFNDMIPGIIGENTNYVDVFAIITRAQRAAMYHKTMIYENMQNLDPNSTFKKNNYPDPGILDKLNSLVTFGTYLKDINGILGKEPGDAKPVKPASVSKVNIDKNNKITTKFSRSEDGTYRVPKKPGDDDAMETFLKSFDASLRLGASFASFAVDYTGTISESFSNSTTSIDLGNQAKQLANKSRALTYNMARGNVGGDVIADAIGGVKDIIAGGLDGVTFGLSNVLATLTGDAYVEMPKRWDDSSMSFQSHSYSMQLISPYNTFISQLQNIYIPLCMILAGVLPLATGKSSYTSPFICTLFNKGVENIRLGMITSVSITRGTSNLGFDKKRRQLAIDVTFTVTDFSTLVTSPVNSSIFTDLFNTTMDDDTPLGTYLSVLGGRDILTDKYSASRLPMKLSRRYMRIAQVFNPNRMGVLFGDGLSSTLGLIAASRELIDPQQNNP